MSAYSSSGCSHHGLVLLALLSAPMKRLSLAVPLCAHVTCFATLCSVKTEYVDNNQETFILFLFHHLKQLIKYCISDNFPCMFLEEVPWAGGGDSLSF